MEKNLKNIALAIETHKNIFHTFLTHFAFLDTMITSNISSYFHKEQEKKIEFTDLVLCDMNSQKQFDIFLKILKKQSMKDEKISSLKKKYAGVRKMRNLLAHSYLVEENNLKFNQKFLKLTRLTNSNGNGYTENLQINEYETQLKLLEELNEELHNMNLTSYKIE